MTKILLFSILLVLVYQFDQVARMFYLLVNKVSRGRVHWVIKESDHYVGMVVTVVTMPLLLYSVMVSEESFLIKLIWLGGIYLIFAVVSGGVWYFLRQARQLNTTQGSTMVFASLALVGGLFHPGLGMVPWHVERDRLVYAKLAFLLSIPAFIGALLKLYYENYQIEMSRVMDSLIVVMIGGVFINIVVRLVEKHFRQSDWSLFSYVRVVVGLVVATILIV